MRAFRALIEWREVIFFILGRSCFIMNFREAGPVFSVIPSARKVSFWVHFVYVSATFLILSFSIFMCIDFQMVYFHVKIRDSK